MGQLEQEQQQHLATSQRCADSLTAIIDDILVFSKLEVRNIYLDMYIRVSCDH